MNLVIGIDVGGTFTDAVCSDGSTTWVAKTPTDPARFANGVMGCCKLLAEQIGCTLEEFLSSIVRFGLGTTAVTNVLATRSGQRVGLITTAGFESALHIARVKRIADDGWLVPPWVPVERSWIRGVSERATRDGSVALPLDAAEVRSVIEQLVEGEGVQALAVSFLWSFKQPEHELAVAAIAREIYPDLPVFCGHQLHPVVREYERMTLAVLNAYTATAIDGLEELSEQLVAGGLTAPLLVLHSGGGATTIAEARNRPVILAASGPAAGTVAAAEVALLAGRADAVCCDMGGTSVDIAIITDGVAHRRQKVEIEGIDTALPAVDVYSIGAGGGSIAWVDSRGLLRVGPKSARATPGPVCYGRGGVEPTVTDAMVVLGYVDPARFMDGRMELDVEGAKAACARLGESLGLTAIDVAAGIRDITLAEMERAVRTRVTSQGLDVGRMSMVAYGGAGALFAPSLARDLGFESVLVPTVASVLSAYGAMSADIRRERVLGIDAVLPLDDSALRKSLDQLLQQVDDELALDGVHSDDRELICEVDMRFHRQKSSMTMVVAPEDVRTDALAAGFRNKYFEQFGPNSLTENASVEVATLRVIGVGRSIRGQLPADLPASETSFLEPSEERVVWQRGGRSITVPVYEMEGMRIGHVVTGPAIVEAKDTSVSVPEGSRVTLGRGRTLEIQFQNDES